ncbi:glutaredoxin 3 [Candidatus Woesearchaeota archaeon]|nr:glutaredoxin 3 [Candidatus Woesearchaeota archaeon]
MAQVVIYTTPYCGYCHRAKQLLEKKGVKYKEINVENNPAQRTEMVQKSGRTTVPEIFIDGKHIGGCEDLYELERQGKLDRLVAEKK